jgi:hypothetical protein
LLSLDFPASVKKGQQFHIVVSQITSTGGAVPIYIEAAARAPEVAERRPWRRVLGQFRLTVPVLSKQDILPDAERLLSILLWTFSTIPTSSRWYPVFQRYLAQLSERTNFLGGNLENINPSPTGSWQTPYVPGQPCDTYTPGGDDAERHRLTGKVTGLIYDHFGDFDGFVLETNQGHKLRFYSHEVRVEERMRRACDERLITTVIFTESGREVLSIILGRD